MPDLDGSIRLGVVVDDKGVSVQINKLDKKLAKQTQGVRDQQTAVKRLEEQYARLVNLEMEPRSLRRMEADLQKAQAEAARLDQEFQRLNQVASIERQAGGMVSPEMQSQLDELAEKMAQADQRADALQKRIREIRMDPTASDEARKLAGDLESAKGKLQILEQEAADTASAVRSTYEQTGDGAGRVLERLDEMANRLRSAISKSANAAAGAVKKLGTRMRDLGKNRGFDRAGKSAERFSKRLKSIMAGAFFFNIISRGLNALVEEMKKYLKANDKFSIALAAVKSNLLTAFQPVMERIIPALNSLMSVLQRITAQIALFMAQLFGTTAERAQEDAKKLKEEADAIEEAGDAAEEAEKKQKKYLASFDTIEKLGEETQDEEKKEEEKPKEGFDTDFSQVQIPSWLEDFWKVFKDSWDKYGAATLQAFKDAIFTIWDLLKAIAQTFMDIWTGGAGLEFLNNIQRLLQVILGIVADIARAFTEAWNSGAGEELMEALFYMLNSILALCISVGAAFREAWNDGTGVEICTKILNTITNIFNIVGNLANRLRDAWEANGNGVAIWSAILGIVDSILGTIGRIAEATEKWSENLNFEPLMSSFRGVLESLKEAVSSIGDLVADIWENNVLPFLSWLIEEALPACLDKLKGLFDYIAENPDAIVELTKNVAAFVAAWKIGEITSGIARVLSVLTAMGPKVLAITAGASALAFMFSKLMMESEPFRKAVGDAFKSVGDALKKVLDLFKELEPILKPIAEVIGSVLVAAVKSLADIIGFLADMLTGAIQKIKDFNDWANRTSTSNKYKSAIPESGGSARAMPTAYAPASLLDAYPHLANGAVISPNSEFLAVLGDQRSGTNIEAPLATIEQALENVLGRRGGMDGGTQVTVNFTGSLAQLARLLEPEIRIEQARLGPNLV